MEETLTNANPREITKIKTHHARIVVDGTSEKPYYSIEWYDHIGYVFKWLEEGFEIVEDNKTNADRSDFKKCEEDRKRWLQQLAGEEDKHETY